MSTMADEIESMVGLAPLFLLQVLLFAGCGYVCWNEDAHRELPANHNNSQIQTIDYTTNSVLPHVSSLSPSHYLSPNHEQYLESLNQSPENSGQQGGLENSVEEIPLEQSNEGEENLGENSGSSIEQYVTSL